jgi:ribosomal protein S18 acetylase RimI-like enzyme
MSELVSARAATDLDEPFLWALFEATAPLDGLDPVLRRLQWQAQRRGYQATWPDAEDLLIIQGVTPIGRTLTWYGSAEIRLIDIALLPQAQGRGLGQRLLRELFAASARLQRPVRGTVSRKNERALRLYLREGFQIVGQTPLHVELERAHDQSERHSG